MNKNTQIEDKKRFIRLKEVLKRTGYSKAWIYRLMASGNFPSSVKIGIRSIAFLESDIDKWIEEKIHPATQGEINTNPAARAVERWIPCAELTPRKLQVVLVYCSENNEYVVAKYLGGGRYLWQINKYGKKHYCNPSHWMRLPESPH